MAVAFLRIPCPDVGSDDLTDLTVRTEASYDPLSSFREAGCVVPVGTVTRCCGVHDCSFTAEDPAPFRLGPPRWLDAGAAFRDFGGAAD